MRDLANGQKWPLYGFYLSQVFEEPRILSRRPAFALGWGLACRAWVTGPLAGSAWN